MSAASPQAARTAGDALLEALAAIGVDRVYGLPLVEDATGDSDGAQRYAEQVAVDDADLALLLADVDGRLSSGFGAAFIAGGILHVSSQPGGTSSVSVVTEMESALEQLSALRLSSVPSTHAFSVDLDLGAPCSIEIGNPAPAEVVSLLDPSLAGEDVVMVVGPGVHRSGSLSTLAEAARHSGCGVLNSFGAKGAFRWDSPFHFGTVGLQERDAELGGVLDASIVLTSGLDPFETPPAFFGPSLVVDISPSQLFAAVHRWPSATSPPAGRPPLYDTIASVVTPLYERGETPLSSARTALHLSGARPPGGVVVADASMAGFWIARTYPTAEPDAVVVPARPQPGFAAAAALVSALIGRPAVGIVDGPIDEATQVIVDMAAARGIPLAIQAWTPASEATVRPMSAEEHASMCLESFEMSSPQIHEVVVDDEDASELVTVAGPIVAWSAEDGDQDGARES